ncbi:hypothetical protein [Streptantibioticus ferralitis]|uniref:Uncharacterized protein n=1 Tax=Streptantibioticus ferralitis TaxID=236510 RepID=A0ABT5Z659_9ACTN|nr:hypothetical protein [Streptantibioticus ferralitis]MDF2259304.1 hypothetical protein [Streptantibioticus ferralitis]
MLNQHEDQHIESPAHPHRTTTIERGAFAMGRCSCGWTGPARRARDSARRDAALHSGAS